GRPGPAWPRAGAARSTRPLVARGLHLGPAVRAASLRQRRPSGTPAGATPAARLKSAGADRDARTIGGSHGRRRLRRRAGRPVARAVDRTRARTRSRGPEGDARRLDLG